MNALLGLLALTASSSAADLPVRVLPQALVPDGVKVDQRTLDAAQQAFTDAVKVTWPDAFAAGLKREGGTVSASADPLVHVGLRVSRFEERRFSIGDSKTVEVLRATVAPFAVDLGTGEVIASGPMSWVATGERVGTDTASDATALRESLIREGVPTAVQRFATTFAPDRLTAAVVESDRKGAWIARGELDGSFVGERLRDANGEIFEVLELGPQASRVVSAAGAASPTAGSELVRPGLARPLGKAPRVLVAAPMGLPEPGPDGEAVTMWVEEALAQAGWVVVPRGTELFGSQLRESAKLDVAQEKLLNAQTPPERVAIPRVWRLSTVTGTDETGTARVEVSTGLHVDVFDLRSGLLVQAVSVSDAATHDTRESVMDEFASAMQVSTVKDAAVLLAKDAGAVPTAPLPSAIIQKVQGDGVSWKSTDAPLAAGVLGEVRRPVFLEDPRTKSMLEGPFEAVGVARVLGLQKKWLQAAWVAPGSARAEDRFTPIGGRAGGPPVVILAPEITGVDAPQIDVSKLDTAVVSGLHGAAGLQVVASPEENALLDAVVTRVAGSGFAGQVQRDPVDAKHTLQTRFTVKLIETTKGKKKTTMVRVDAEAEVQREGKPVMVQSPSMDAPDAVYRMWTERGLQAKQGERRMSLALDDLEGVVREALYETSVTLGQRVAVLIGG